MSGANGRGTPRHGNTPEQLARHLQYQTKKIGALVERNLKPHVGYFLVSFDPAVGVASSTGRGELKHMVAFVQGGLQRLELRAQQEGVRVPKATAADLAVGKDQEDPDTRQALDNVRAARAALKREDPADTMAALDRVEKHLISNLNRG